MKIAFIICGALAREVLAIINHHHWSIDVYGIPAIDHMNPDRITPHVEEKFKSINQLYDHVLIIYGECGTKGALDAFLSRYGVERMPSPHCYAMFGGQSVDALLEEEPGTFFLTDFLVRGFRGTIWHGLGLDKYPELIDDYFQNYRRIVYLTQIDDPALTEKAKTISETLGLPLEVRHTGYGQLEQQLVEWVQNHR